MTSFSVKSRGRGLSGRVTLALAAILVLSACGGDNSEGGADASEEVRALAESSPTIQAILDRGVLRGGVAIAPPWLMENPSTGELEGPNTLFVEAIATALGVKHEYVDAGWDTIVAGLQAKNYDIAIAPVFATAARLEVIDIVTFTSAGTCYLVRADNDSISSLDDFDSPDIVAGMLSGTGTEQAFREKYPSAQIDSVAGAPGQIERMQDVLAGRVDLTSVDSPMGAKYAEQFKGQIKLIPDVATCLTDPDLPLPIGFGVNKGDQVFYDFVQDVINDMEVEYNKALLDYSTSDYMEIAS